MSENLKGSRSIYQIGSLCMDIIDFELARYDQWKEDMDKRRRHFESTTGLSLFPIESGNNLDKKAITSDEIWNADGPLDYEVKRRSVELMSVAADTDVNKMKEDIEKSRKKFKSLTRKQEQLLRGEILVK